MRKDLTGQVFGTIKVLEFAGKTKNNSSLWNCQCNKCGRKCIKQTQTLKKGCAHCANETHGDSYIRLYKIWINVKWRCKHDKNYHGINLYTGWNDYNNFKNWSLANGYKNNLEIDRIDFNGDYCPDNCRWVEERIQQNNKSNNIYITIDNVIHTLTEWARIYGRNERTVRTRIRRGWKAEDAIKTNPDKTKGQTQITMFNVNGISKSLYDWCEIYRISITTVKKRMKKGMSLLEALGVSNG